MRRRDFIVMAAGAVGAWSHAARTQQSPMPVIGYLGISEPETDAPLVAAFLAGLGEAGYVEGQSVAIEYRWAEGRYERVRPFIEDLVGRGVNAIVTSGGNIGAAAAKNATSAIPVVFVTGSDPVASGLVASLGRPGGNVTGVTFFTTELTSKRVELISELVPQARVIAVLMNPTNPSAERIAREAEQAVQAQRRQLHILTVASETEIDNAFAELVKRGTGALFIGGDAFLNSRREQLVALAARHAVPTIYSLSEAATADGLISYGPSRKAIYRQLGIYTGRILNGEKPGDLPVQQPTKFELVINLKTAKALGLTVPPTILARADELIE